MEAPSNQLPSSALAASAGTAQRGTVGCWLAAGASGFLSREVGQVCAYAGAHLASRPPHPGATERVSNLFRCRDANLPAFIVGAIAALLIAGGFRQAGAPTWVVVVVGTIGGVLLGATAGFVAGYSAA